MPITCIVVGCGNRSNRDKVKFYCVPAITNNKFLTNKNELSRKRRNLWLAAIKRDDLTETKIKYQRVCSHHFITGKPASLEDENHPDWVPSQNMGHTAQKFVKQPGDIERKERLDKKRKRDRSYEKKFESDVALNCNDENSDNEQVTGISVQTDLTMTELDVKFEQLHFASAKIDALNEKIQDSPYGLVEEISNNEKWKYYTGFQYTIVNLLIFKFVEPCISSTSTTVLSPFNQLLLVLIKLRLNPHFKDLAYHFKISPSTATKYFENIIDILYKRFKILIKWPDRDAAQKNIPSCFKENFHEKTTVIIDCFEIFIEKPPVMTTQQQCWSNYKHHSTVKILIGITPHGFICYISAVWGGRASDKQIVEMSNFCSYINPGDIVLADRGFLIQDTLQVLQAKLIIPAFTKGKNQLHPIEIEDTRKIAHVRIHVERIIGTIKNKFNILKGTIPISMLKKGNDTEKISTLDKIVTVCCSFINIAPPIIPL